MTDIVAIEIAKAREQVAKLAERHAGITPRNERILTALLEAKADVLAEYAPDAEPLWRSEYGRPGPYHVLLRREVTSRRLRGL